MPFKAIRSFLIAKSYDYTMRSTERICLQEWRRELLAQAEGDLLEIGAGTGVNLPHYPETITRMVLSEPDTQMRKKLQRKTAQIENSRLEITPWEAESIEMPDASFDTIVSTLVLCSVPSLESSLKEIYRLLRPNGVLLFLEHVISDHPPTLAWQRRIEPFWSFCAGNCRLTRNTAAAIDAAGLKIEQFTEAPMTGTPAFVRKTIRGAARKSPSSEATDNFIIDDNFDFDSTPTCPACASNNVAIFVYGKPRLSRIIIEGFESGKIISGGCMIRKTAPKWHCHNCNKDFGRLL
ncbi:MAG: class I SAM-dependent methyltransferase [Desulfuromonadales bacterium]|nr:class I SAM-dependent methyltransferase [Desulfuromonadales bacterium]